MAKSSELSHQSHTIRLGEGEYQHKGDEAIHARIEFFRALQEYCPEVVKELADIVPESEPSLPIRGIPEDFQRLSESFHEQFYKPRMAVAQWARRFNLTKDDAVPVWLLESALFMVARWRGSPDLPRNLSEFIDLTETSRAMRAYLRDLPDSKCEISLQSTWNPFFETKSEVRSRILAELDRRMDEIEALARRTGVTPPKKDDGSHFHWLALAQVRAMTPREVQASCQDAEMATVEAVRAALKELRGLIGLSSPVKRGRPWNGKR